VCQVAFEVVVGGIASDGGELVAWGVISGLGVVVDDGGTPMLAFVELRRRSEVTA